MWGLLSMGAERLCEPLGPHLRVDLGVDYEGAISPLQPVPNRRQVFFVSDSDALGPGRPRERSEVGVWKARHVYRASHGAEVVHLRAVGCVVVDDDEHRQT